MDADDFIVRVAEWADSDPRILGAAVCGSYARGEQRPDSDLDLCLLTSAPRSLLDRHDWIQELAPGARIAGPVEDYGLVQSLRVNYASLEVEFGIAAADWAEAPIDRGTAAVINDGFRILVDPDGRLAAARVEAGAMNEGRPGG